MTNRFYLRYAGKKALTGEVYEIVDSKAGVIVTSEPMPREDLVRRCKDLNEGADKQAQSAKEDAWTVALTYLSAAPRAPFSLTDDPRQPPSSVSVLP